MKRSAAVIVAAAALAAAASPSSADQADARPIHLLNVPYLPQNEALCGGAATAMVMRFWGARDVYADTFAGLVDAAAEGIHAGDLVRDLAERGWPAAAMAGDGAAVQRSLDAGRPVITLIEDRPGRFHYVVMLGWVSGRVVFHDPARAPFRLADEAAFLSRWARADNWMLVLGPRPSMREPDQTRVDPPSRPSPCDGMVEEGVRLAGTGQAADAGALLEVAARSCPDASAPLRELAGLAALREDWPGAADAARRALARDGTDAHAARTLATALFLQGRADDALAAWNRLGEPLIDVVDVKGLDRTRYDAVARALDLQPRTLLTPLALDRARRRLAELPAAMQSRVGYAPTEGSRAVVDAVIVERPLMPAGAVPLAALGFRALTDREVGITMGSPTGGGDAVSASWRWWESRPRIGVKYAAPAPSGIGAVWTIEAFTERQTYRMDGRDIQERREGVSLRIADWTSGRRRWEAALGVDQWSGGATSVSFGASLEHHAAADRLVTVASGSLVAGGVRTASAAIDGLWRSRVRREGAVWLASATAAAAGEGAPFALWSGAGTGHGRPTLLRAHPLLDDGIVTSSLFGRHLVAVGTELRRWLAPARAVPFAPAVFIDAAGTSRGVGPEDPALQVDAGAGLRVSLPLAGILRVDYAHGLRDGRNAWSIGWTR